MVLCQYKEEIKKNKNEILCFINNRIIDNLLFYLIINLKIEYLKRHKLKIK